MRRKLPNDDNICEAPVQNADERTPYKGSDSWKNGYKTLDKAEGFKERDGIRERKKDEYGLYGYTRPWPPYDY